MRAFRALAFALILLFVQGAQQDAVRDTQEVRIRSGPYSPVKAVITVQANLVELGVTVRTRQGQPVGGLKAADFELTDAGKPQKISFFSEQKASRAGVAQSEPNPSRDPANGTAPTSTPDAHPPHYIALFFDDTHTESMALQKGRDAAKKFISDGIQQGDRVAIFAGSGSPVADFTNDTQVLLSALDQLKPHPEIGVRGIGSCPTLTAYQAYVIIQRLDEKVRDAAIQEAARCALCETPECFATAAGRVQGAAETAWSLFRPQSASVLDRLGFVIRRLATAPGTRVLVLISPGFISGTLEQQSSGLMDAALRGHIVINSLDSVGLSTNQSQGMQKLVLGDLMSTAAIATGGKFIQNNNDLSGGIRGLAEPAEVSYILGFSPTGEPDEKYHALKVKMRSSSEYRAEFRPGYFSTKAPEKAAEKPVETIQQRIDRLAASSDELEEVPATVGVAVEEKDGRELIHVDISVVARDLKFIAQGDRHVQELTFVTVIQDSAGNFIDGKQAVMSLALTPATLADLQAKGIAAATSFSLPKGVYQVREVIREAVENHLTAKSAPVVSQ